MSTQTQQPHPTDPHARGSTRLWSKGAKGSFGEHHWLGKGKVMFTDPVLLCAGDTASPYEWSSSLSHSLHQQVPKDLISPNLVLGIEE